MIINWKRGFSDGCAFKPCAEPMAFMYRAGHAYGLSDAIATYGYEWPFPEHSSPLDNVPPPVEQETIETAPAPLSPIDQAPF